MKIVTKEEIENRIKLKWPNEPFKIIEYKRVSQPIIIKCLKCGETKKYSTANNFLSVNRKGVCSCYNENNTIEKHKENKERVLELISQKETLEFISFSIRELTGKSQVNCYCSRCDQYFSKVWQNFIKYPACPYCEGKELQNTKAFRVNIPEAYELIGEYVNQETKILVRHKKCGFIWKTLPRNLNGYTGCPRCNKKQSKGEQRLEEYFTKNEISFEREKSFKNFTNKKTRYDFFVPSFNLVIEYMGEQHHKEVPHFSKTLKEQKEIDEKKKEDAISHGYNYLRIEYFQYNKIEEILDNWFNDYPTGVKLR